MIFASIISPNIPNEIIDEYISIKDSLINKGLIMRKIRVFPHDVSTLTTQVVSLDKIPAWYDDYVRYSFPKLHRKEFDKIENEVEKLKLSNACALIIGEDGKQLCDFVLTWHKIEKLSNLEGGLLGHSLRIAKFFKIPIYNLAEKPFDLDY